MNKVEAKQWVRNRVKEKLRKILKSEPFTPEAIVEWGSKLIKKELYHIRRMYMVTYIGNSEWEPMLYNGEKVTL